MIGAITANLCRLKNSCKMFCNYSVIGTRSKMAATPSSSSEHLSVVMTTKTADDVTQTTADDAAMTSLLPRGIRFYFQCAVPVIGVVGVAANALILYALVASKQQQKRVMIFNLNREPDPHRPMTL